MGRISARLPDSYVDGLGSIARTNGVTKTDLIEHAISTFLAEHEGDLPTYLQRDTTHDRIVRQNRHRMRRLQFKQRVHDKLVSFLEDERGETQRYPPHPDYVESDYVESLRTAVREEYPEREEEFLTFLQSEMQWYRSAHPATEAEVTRDRQKILYQIAYHLQDGRSDLARQHASRAVESDGWESSDTAGDLLNDARRKLERDADGEWLQEWEEATGGEHEQ